MKTDFKQLDLETLSFEALEDLARELSEFLIHDKAYSLESVFSALNVMETILILYHTYGKNNVVIVYDNEKFSSISDLLGTNSSTINKSYALNTGLSLSLYQEKPVFVILDINRLMDGNTYKTLLDIQSYQPKLNILLVDEQQSLLRHYSSFDAVIKNLRISKSYVNIKTDIKKALQNSTIGQPVLESLRQIRNRVKNNVIEATLFTELGMNYQGPINGQNFKELHKAFLSIKDLDGVNILHIETRLMNKDPKALKFPNFKLDDSLPKNYIDFIQLLEKEFLAYCESHDIAVLVNATADIRLKNVLEKHRNVEVYYASVNTLVSLAATLNKAAVLIIDNAYQQLIFSLFFTAPDNLTILIPNVGLKATHYAMNHKIYDLIGLSSFDKLRIHEGDSLSESYAMTLKHLKNPEKTAIIRFPDIKENFVKLEADLNWKIILPIQKTTIITYGPSVKLFEAAIKSNQLEVGLINARVLNEVDERIFAGLSDIDSLLVYDVESYEPILRNTIVNAMAKEGKNFKLIDYSLNSKNLNLSSREIKDQYLLKVEHVLKKILG